MSPPGATTSRLAAVHEGLIALRPAVEAGVPWPLSHSFGTEPEATWGPLELLAHVTEMLPFWLGEVERIIGGTVEPVPFGRVASDVLRIAIIERDRSLPTGELYARLANGVARWSDRIARLSSEEAGKRGLHPTLGELTVEQIADRMVVSHLEDHRHQLESILADREAG